MKPQAIEHTVTPALPGLGLLVDAVWDVRIADPVLARALQATALPIAEWHVVFCYGATLRLEVPGGRPARRLRSHVSGPTPAAHRLQAEGAAGVLAVHLTAAGALGFAGGALPLLALHRTPLSDLLPPQQVAALEARLAACSHARERSAVAQHALLRWLRPAAGTDILSWAWQRLRREPALRIATLADELGTSERSLQRGFRQRYGLAPKQFAQATRLRTAVHLSRGSASWAQVALQSGFADQAHLIRAFRDVFGQTPQQFRAGHALTLARPGSAPFDTEIAPAARAVG